MSATGRRLVLAALICLAAAQGCTAPDGGTSPVPGSSTGEQRDEAVRVAEQAAVALTSLDHQDGAAGYDRLLELLTGPARQEWEQRRVEYLATIVADGVASDGVVAASGVAALDQSAVTVLAAVTATVSTNQSPTPEERRHRLTLSLINTPTGWKVSQLQFVE